MAKTAGYVAAGLLIAALMMHNPAPSEASRVDYDVLGVQYNLREMGFDPGPLDGQMGGQTRRALREFQADRGIPETGELDRETINYLIRFLRTREIPIADAVIERVDETFEEDLIDPDSRRVRQLRLFRMWDGPTNMHHFIVCGEVNARNRMGGFTGWQTFVIRFATFDDDISDPSLSVGFLDIGPQFAAPSCRWNFHYLLR